LLTLAQLEVRLARLDAASSRAAPLAPVAAAVAQSADTVAQLLTQALGELLPGAAVLSWDRRRPGLVAGQMAADGLVFQFRCDANQISYRPAWDGLSQGRWEARSAGFLAARSPGLRLDAPGAGGKKRCSRGYGCGNSCISLKNECRLKVSSAASKTRLQRLQALANAGDAAAGTLAGQEQAKRNSQAAAIKGQRQQERAARAPKTPPRLAGQVRVVAPASIEVDPERFQFKLGHGAQGEVGSLRGVRKWDENLAGVVSVWQDPADGKTYVVNGHNRLGLAKRHGAEGLTVRYLKAASAAEARAIGALQNIAEGAGTPVDAAKFFRDSNIRSQTDVEKLGLPLSSGRAAQGLGLARLPAEMFRSVVDGDLSASRGAIIGNSGLDGPKMSEIGKLLRQRKNISDGTLAEFVEALAVSERQSQQTFDLFGANETLVDNGLARAELTNAIAKKISKEKRLFKMVSNSQAAATLAEKAGNVINKGESAEVASAADQLGRTFKALKNVSGPMATAINAAAQQVSEGANKTTVQRKLYAEVVAAMELEFKGKRRDGWGQSTIDRFAELEARIDAAKKKCSTGYGCGSTCISLRKECRARPSSSIGKERLKRLLALAGGGVSDQRGIAPVRAAEATALAGALEQRREEKAQQLKGTRQKATADDLAKRLIKAEANLAAKSKMPAPPPGNGKPGVKVEIQRAKPGGEYGPDGHWYPGGAWMSQGQFVGGKEQALGSGEQPASATGKENSGASQRVIRNKEKPRREQPTEPKGKGLDQPVGLKKTAAKNDEDFFNDRGFVLYPRPKGAAGLNGLLFDAAVIQRMSTEELGWATDQILTMGNVKRSDLGVVNDLENAATRFGSEKDYLNYQRSFTRNQLIGVDDKRFKAGLIFMDASRNLGHTSPAQQRLRTRRKTTENPPERKGEQGDWVWGLNNVFRAVQLRRDRMAAPSVLTNPGRQDPGLASKAKQPGLNAQDVTTSTQQAAFARQQQQAAKAAGDQSGAQAWRKEERTVERNRLATAIGRNKQSQSSLFGVTEYDETMPLFKKRGDGRRLDADILEARIDALRRKCQTGYNCGSTCISLRKECRSRPGSSISKERLKRLQQLARGEVAPRGLGVPRGAAATALATDIQGRRNARAAELTGQRAQAGLIPTALPFSDQMAARIRKGIEERTATTGTVNYDGKDLAAAMIKAAQSPQVGENMRKALAFMEEAGIMTNIAANSNEEIKRITGKPASELPWQRPLELAKFVRDAGLVSDERLEWLKKDQTQAGQAVVRRAEIVRNPPKPSNEEKQAKANYEKSKAYIKEQEQAFDRSVRQGWRFPEDKKSFMQATKNMTGLENDRNRYFAYRDGRLNQIKWAVLEFACGKGLAGLTSSENGGYYSFGQKKYVAVAGNTDKSWAGVYKVDENNTDPRNMRRHYAEHMAKHLPDRLAGLSQTSDNFDVLHQPLGFSGRQTHAEKTLSIHIHELGHVVDNFADVRVREIPATAAGPKQMVLSHNFLERVEKRPEAVKKALREKRAPSNYALTNAEELFAESFAAWVFAPRALKRHHPELHAWVEDRFTRARTTMAKHGHLRFEE